MSTQPTLDQIHEACLAALDMRPLTNMTPVQDVAMRARLLYIIQHVEQPMVAAVMLRQAMQGTN